MGFIDSLKGMYYFFEDRWYGLLDKIDPKIPIYKIIDPIDKVIPSFILFLLFVAFFIIFFLYVVKFTSPYEVTFVITDGATKETLSGVLLGGTINEEIFNEDGEKTNTNGELAVTITSVKKNAFELISSLVFEDSIYLEGELSASKTGYEPIVKLNRELEKKNTIRMEKLPIDPPFPDTYTIRLLDSQTDQLIVDATGASYVKYRCDNKNIPNQPKRVTDAQDGTTNGIFVLNEPECAFLLVEASAPGYEPLGNQITLPIDESSYEVSLTKIFSPNEGTVRVGVYKTVSDRNVFLSGIRVDLQNLGIPYFAYTDNGGWAEKTLAPGTYTITISDANHYPITADANITVSIEKGVTKQVLIKLTEVPLENRRMVYFRAVDSNNSTPVKRATVDLVRLSRDVNGNYFGTNSANNNTYYYSGAPTMTDNNGIYQRTTLTTLDTNIFAVVKKDGYVYKLFKPRLMQYSEAYETVTLTTADETNSGNVRVRVKTNAGKILTNANAYAYVSGTFDGVEIHNIKILGAGKSTDINGTAMYTELPSGYYYRASAEFDESFSGIVDGNILDANTTLTIDVNLNINAAFLKIELIDAQTSTQVTTPGTVTIYTVQDTQLIFSETLTKSATTGAYTSRLYPKSAKLAILATASDHIQNTVYVDGLVAGENKYRIKLYPTSILDTDANVSVFFDDIYAAQDVYASGVSTIDTIHQGQEYKARVDIVTNRALDFNTILGMIRINGPAKVTNVLPSLDPYRKAQNSVSCNTTAQDGLTGVHDDNYYLPVGCADGNKIQGGFRWGDANIPLGTYTYVISFKVNTNTTGQALSFKYRAKETNPISATKKSETRLKSVEFIIGTPFRTGIFFVVTQKGVPETITPNHSSARKLSFFPNTQNPADNSFTVQFANNTNKSLTGGTITAYSYKGSIQYSGTGYSDPRGNIFFDSAKTLSSKVIASGIAVGPSGSTSAYTITSYPDRLNTSDWIVLVAEGFSGDTNKYVVFVSTKSVGKNLVLSAEFLAGTPDQIFDGVVMDATGSATPTIRSMEWVAKRNCASENTLAHQGSGTVEADTFRTTVPGVYEYMKDCVYVTIYADDGEENVYNPIINKKIMASSGGSIDPALACIDVFMEDQTINDSLEPEIYIGWDEERNVRIENNCTQQVTVILDTGLDCTRVNTTPVTACLTEVTIPRNEEIEYVVRGRNIDYAQAAPRPNTTDILGYFPLIVKGKMTSSGKKFTVAARAHIHLRNDDQCFAISKDYFDFISTGITEYDVNFINSCQYTRIGDYFIPKATLNTFGYELNSLKPIDTSVSFTPIASVAGASIVIDRVPQEYTLFGSVGNGEFEKKYLLYNQGMNQNNGALPRCLCDTSTTTRDCTTGVLEDRVTFFTTNTIEGKYGTVSNGAYAYTGSACVDQKQEGGSPKYDGYVSHGSSLGENKYRVHIPMIDTNGVVDKLQIRFFDLDNNKVGIPAPYGAQIDGAITVHFSDGNTQTITPRMNFALDANGVHCTGSPTAEEYCEIGSEMDTFVFGLLYVVLPNPKEHIDYIDINIIGNVDPTYLELQARPRITITQYVDRPRLVTTTTPAVISLTTTPIVLPALEGVIFTIKDVSELTALSQTAYTTIANPSITISSNNDKVVAWIDGSSLKAMYVGADYAGHNDGVIDYTISKSFGQGISYGSIDVVDYVVTGGNSVSGE